jgi:hypothetical protein
MKSLISKKFASKTSKNHNQVLLGGIFACPFPLAAPGLVAVDWLRPADVELLLRRVGCPVKFMGHLLRRALAEW